MHFVRPQSTSSVRRETAEVLARQAYRKLREAILVGKLPPGTPLSRRRLADELGISPAPVGDAIARMEGEVGLQALFRRFPELTLDGEPTRRPTRVLRGYDEVPVRLEPASVSA